MVATFIGSPKMNLVPGSIQPHDDGRLSVKLLGCELFLPAGARLRPGHEGPQDVMLGIRPTDFTLGGGRNVEASEIFTGTVDLVEPMGAETFVALNCANQILSCRAPGREHMTVGEQRQILGSELLTSRDNSLAFAQIAPASPDELAACNHRVHGDLGTVAFDVFLHDHRIRAARHRSSGENANSFARGDLAISIDARCLFANHMQNCSLPAVT
jgi:plasmid stability protein